MGLSDARKKPRLREDSPNLVFDDTPTRKKKKKTLTREMRSWILRQKKHHCRDQSFKWTDLEDILLNE